MKGKKNLVSKRLILVLVLFSVVTVCSFAQTTGSTATTTTDFGLNSRVGILVELVNAPWVKGVAFIALVIECIAMITMGRQEPGMFKKFIPWIVGTIIFMAAGTITKTFLNIGNTSTLKTDLGLQ